MKTCTSVYCPIIRLKTVWETADRALTALEIVNNNGPAINIPAKLMYDCMNGCIDEWMDGWMFGGLKFIQGMFKNDMWYFVCIYIVILLRVQWIIQYHLIV